MGSDVHLEGAHGLVLLVAVLTAEVIVLVADNFEGLRLEGLVVVVLEAVAELAAEADWRELLLLLLEVEVVLLMVVV